MITRETVWKTLRGSLDAIVDDANKTSEKVFSKYTKKKNMTKAFHDYQEMAGPDTLAERDSGSAIQMFEVMPGFNTRVFPRNFAGQMTVTEETIEDNEIEKAIDAGRRLAGALHRTKEVDGAALLNNAFDTNYTFGDGQPVASASHTLPSGDTFSNIMTTPYAPSLAGLQVIRQQAAKLPGHHGGREPRMIEKIVCPVDLQDAWEVVLGSKMDPSTANNAINNMAGKGIELVVVPRWTATTKWFVITDAEYGLCYFERGPIKKASWMEQGNKVMHYSTSQRWNFASLDARGTLWSNA